MPFNGELAKKLGPTLKLHLNDLALRSRDLFMADPPTVLQHYTTLDGAQGIITNKSLRLTKFSYLNDQTELKHAVKLLRVRVNRVLKNVQDEGIRDLLEPLLEDVDRYSGINVCVASFCVDGDLLSQWQSYGGSGRGVCLGFSSIALKNAAKSVKGYLLKCVYHRQKQEQVINDLVLLLIDAYEEHRETVELVEAPDLMATLRQFFYFTFLRVAFALKDDHFMAEEEWRLITEPLPSSAFSSIVSNSHVTVFFEHKFGGPPFDFLEEICLGPSPGRRELEEALHILMARNELKPPMLRFSQIPLRMR